MAQTMAEFAERIVKGGMARPDTIVPCAPEEVEEIRADQGVPELPRQYQEFLLVMGRQAGDFLKGTDFFYPTVLGLGQDGRELLEENHALGLLVLGSVIIGMHQGYELYWIEPAGRVHWYKEGSQSVYQSWPTLLELLVEELTEERAVLGK
jgi:hypothetical protein